MRNLIAYFGGNAKAELTYYLGEIVRIGENDVTEDLFEDTRCLLDLTAFSMPNHGITGVAGVQIFLGNKEFNRIFRMSAVSKTSFSKNEYDNTIVADNGQYYLVAQNGADSDRVTFLDFDGDHVITCEFEGVERINSFIIE